MCLSFRHPYLGGPVEEHEVPKKSEGIRTALFNARSVRNKGALIKSWLKNKNLIGVTDTWLKESDPSSSFADLQKYVVHEKDRLTHAGRVAVICQKNSTIIRRSDSECADLELLFIEIVETTGNLLAGVYYRPPSDAE